MNWLTIENLRTNVERSLAYVKEAENLEEGRNSLSIFTYLDGFYDNLCTIYDGQRNRKWFYLCHDALDLFHCRRSIWYC